MRLTRILVAFGLAATVLTLTAVPAIAEDPTSTVAAVTTNEQDCHESSVTRAVLTSKLRELVPARYTLVQVGPVASRFIVTTYTCSQVSVDGQPVVGNDKPTTVTIGSAAVSARDGVSAPSQYILWYGTDNPVLFAKLHQTGLPVSFLPRADATITDNGTTHTVRWALRGAGLDYDLTATNGPEPATDPATGPVTGTTRWWYDGPEGDLLITYTNRIATANAPVTADFTGNEMLGAPGNLVAQTSLLQISGVAFPYVRGSWASTVEFQ
jgi:hypothetical protein